MASKNKTKVLIFDDRPGVRQGLGRLIDCETELEVCGITEPVDQILEGLDKEDVDLAIVDMCLKDADGVKLAEHLRLQCPHLPILMLSICDIAECIEEGKESEGGGMSIKEDSAEQIKKVVNYAHSLIRSNILGFTILVEI